VSWASLAARARASGPREAPFLQRSNVALQPVAQWQHARVDIGQLGLPPQPDWDGLGPLD